MKRMLLCSALVLFLVILGISRPSLDRGVELSSGEFDSNSDCIVRGDELTYHTPANVLGDLLGGHGRGFEFYQFNRKSYRIVFASASDELELIRVRDCDVHFRGEKISVDGNSVDSAIASLRGRAVVDRVPNRGSGPAREMVIQVPWDRLYRVRSSDVDLDTFDMAVPLVDAQVLVVRGLEGRGDGIRYEVYDYANRRRLRFHIPEETLPAELNDVVVVRGVAGCCVNR